MFAFGTYLRVPCLFIGMLLCVFVSSVAAQESVFIYSDSGKPIFHLNFVDKGQITHGDEKPSFREFTTLEKTAILSGSAYWVALLGPAAQGFAPVIVSTYDEENADASSSILSEGEFAGSTKMAAEIGNGAQIAENSDMYSQIRIGVLGNEAWQQWAEPSPPSQLALTTRPDLRAVMVHELGHALGVSSAGSTKNPDGYYYLNLTTKFESHFVDSRGVPFTGSEDGTRIVEANLEITPLPNDFVVGVNNHIYFQGDNVNAVLGGAFLDPADAVTGIPINGFENGEPEFSHLELRYSSMSHQNYRSYTTWMEAEIALLQDIGFEIDRKNFFGSSVYGSDISLINDNGFFARNAAGTAYLPGTYNTSAYGLGLHIYGDRNTITQRADILSRGAAGVGIRIDGQHNKLSIDPATRVHANGAYGTGLLVAYGKNHSLNQRGDVEALGTGGIGARFDFGTNILGSGTEYRGSYIRADGDPDNPHRLTPENDHDGPLVTNFTVSGGLKGRAASIFIAKNAFVQNINILQGAFLQGDIVSEWDKNNPLLTLPSGVVNDDLVTHLNFGLKTDAAGDPNFLLRFDGNIHGPTGMDMQLEGGKLTLNGTVNVQEVSIRAGATLGGNADYTVSKGFTNAGILAPGNSIGKITIDGTFTQSATGRLNVEFDGTGRTDVLVITGAATLDGDIIIAPVPSFYRGTVQFSQQDFLQAQGTLTGAFNAASFTVPDSPTLSMTMSSTGNNFSVSTQRNAQAYSRYAAHGNAARVGTAILGIAESASPLESDMQTLLSTLDFSAADGSVVRRALTQLSPAVYASAAQASLDTGRLLTRMVTNRVNEKMDGDARADSSSDSSAGTAPDTRWKAFVTPYAASAQQDGQHSLAAYTSTDVGLLGGLERNFDHGLLLGLHLAFNTNRMEAQDQLDARNSTQSLHLGVHGLLNPQEWGGAYLYGLARGGVENARMTRTVAFGEYSRSNTSQWTGFTAGAALGGGYQWQAEAWTFGPVVGLEYGMVHRPELTEADGQATRLHLDSTSLHSLRSAAGARVAWDKRLNERTSIKVQAAAQWLHELMDDSQRTDASFAGHEAYSFTSKTRTLSRDSMGLQAGLILSIDDTKHISAQLGTEFFRPGYRAVQGNISLSWEF